MRCARCQHDNPAEARFCLECGGPFAVQCPRCSTELPAAAKLCLSCGHAQGPPSSRADARYSSPEAYTPGHLAEKILTSRGALEGERKQVTVPFADVKGSMELLGRSRLPRAASGSGWPGSRRRWSASTSP